MNTLKALISIGFADIIGTGITSIFWFYLATLIEPEKYGEIHYFLGIALIGSAIALVGTQNTLIVYTAKNVKIQSTFYFISLVIGSISSFFIILVFYRIDAAIVLLGYIINTLVIGDLLGRKLYASYSKYVLIQKILTLVLGIGFFFAFGAEGIIFALALSYIAFTVRIYKGFKDLRINFSLLRSRFEFIGNNYVMGLVAGFGSQIDKLIIAPLLGYSFLGNYSLALQILSVLTIFTTILYKYLLSQDASGLQNTTLKRLAIFVSIGIALFAMIVLPIIIPQFFPKYVDSVQAIQIMGFSVIPGTIGMIYTSKFLSAEKSRFVLLSNFISIITIIFGIVVLGNIFGIFGIALAYVLTTSFGAISLVIFNKFIKW